MSYYNLCGTVFDHSTNIYFKKKKDVLKVDKNNKNPEQISSDSFLTIY